MKKLFLIIGAPGSGKTTDASLIAERNDGISHYSTGDLLRAESASGSELGKQIESYTSKGNLVPLEIVINTVVAAIKNCADNVVVIDGFPRSVEQMTKLDEVLSGNSEVELASVIEVVVSEEVAKDRVLGRARGADDNAEVFYNRMKVFMEPLKAIQEFYGNKGIYCQINAERTIDEIVSDVDAYIKSKI